MQAEPDRRVPGADPGQEARPAAGADTGQEAWPAARADTPAGAWPPPEPAGREPDYPALFGELYRRSAAQLDPIWEVPPAAEPLPEPGQPDPSAAAWPFEETTQSWEPSDRSFVWPADELPTPPTEWEPGASRSWLDDPAPAPQPPTPPSDQTAGWPGSGPTSPSDQAAGWPGAGPTPRPPDQTAAWPGPRPTPEAGQASAWSAGPGLGNGVPPPSAPSPGDWAAAIPTDVPAARRGSDPGGAASAWPPDPAVDIEPAVPLGRTQQPPAGTSSYGAAGPDEAQRTAPSDRRRFRQPEDRPGRSWPRIVAVISWIVLVMVVCWFYVFPWLERVLPESF